MNFFYFFFGIVILIVSTQTVTTWYVFDSFSTIKNKGIKLFQSLAFCSIISLIIIGSVFIGKTKIAIAGALLETAINIFYYAQDFFDKGFTNFNEKKKTRRNKTIVRFWRKYWLKFIFGIIIPAGIYICSELMLELSK